MNKRVVVTGLGIVCSIGSTVNEFWSNALSAKSVVEKIPEKWNNYSRLNSCIWSPLPEIDYSSYKIGRIEQKQLDQTGLMSLASAFQAIDQADLHIEQLDEKRNTFYIKELQNSRAAVYFGTGIGGVNTLIGCVSNRMFSSRVDDFDLVIGELEKNRINNEFSIEKLKEIRSKMLFPDRFNPFAVSMIMPNACSADIGIKFNLGGPNETFCSACASGTIAIGNAFKGIRAGEFDLALSGGAEYSYDDYGALFYSFDVVKALVNGDLDKEKANRPFDRNRSGFLFSQGGAAVLVLEELEHAKRRGAHPLAEIIGYAENSDSHNIMVMEPGGKRIVEMLGAALKDAGVNEKEIDYINAHGTGTQVNDETETSVIENIFGKNTLVNSTKSLIGHTLGASGAIEALVTVLSIKNKTTHICKNLEEPVRELNFVLKENEYPIATAVSQSFGFGGHNAALVFGKYKE